MLNCDKLLPVTIFPVAQFSVSSSFFGLDVFVSHTGILGLPCLHSGTDPTGRHHGGLLVDDSPEESLYCRHAFRQQ